MGFPDERPPMTVFERAVRHRAVVSPRSAGMTIDELREALYLSETRAEKQAAALKSLGQEAKQERKLRDDLQASFIKQKAQLDKQIQRAEKFKSAYEALKGSTYVKVARAATAPIRRAQKLAATRKDVQDPLLQKSVPDPHSRKALPPSPQPLQKSAAPLSDDTSNRIKEAKSKYFTEGSIQEPLEMVNDLVQRPQGPDAAFLRQLGGAGRLRAALPEVPPRQPNAGYFVESGRVLYCAHSTGGFNSNGYSTRTAGLTRAMAEDGDVIVVARPGYPWDAKVTRTPEKRDRFELTIDGVDHVFNPGPSLREDPLDQYIHHAADIVAREAVIHRASLIHAASNHITALPALIAARRLGIPFVYEVRGLWEITEASAKPAWEDSERFALAVELESLVAREADEILAITVQVRDELVRRGANPERIELLPNAADPFEFAALPPDGEVMKRIGFGPENVVVGYAGSVLAYEGLDTLVRGFSLALDRRPELRLLIVGNGPAQGSIRALVAELGIDDYVVFTGRVAASEVPRLVCAMDIVACPRISNAVTEMVSPLKPLEAMSAGRAVIASDVAPLKDLIGGSGERGVLFTAGDQHSLSDAIVRLASSAETRADMGRAARKWVTENRSWAAMAIRANDSHARLRRRALYSSASPAPELAQMTVALVADEFTTDSLRSECNVVLPTSEDWRQELNDRHIDALFVESAWEGNGGTWKGKVGYYNEESFKELRAMIAYCKSRGIPTIFWNKEDPVHFNRFRMTAKYFDHVFTTDADCIPNYFVHRGARCRTIASLPFWAQPQLHNPLPATSPSQRSIAYGGTYYGDRYPKRSRELLSLLEALKPSGLAIYDRQATLVDSPYRFPPSLAGYVQGGLSYPEMLQAYKAHPVHLNVNSVSDSPTMFSRRVVELAATGTPVISGAGRGVQTLFGELVAIPANADEAALVGSLWMQNERERNSDGWRLHRHAFRAHLAGHRLAYALRTAGLRVRVPELKEYELEVPALDDENVSAILAQSHRPKSVRLSTGNTGTNTNVESERLRQAGIKLRTDCAEAGTGTLRIWLGNAMSDRTAAEDLCRAADFTDGEVQLDASDVEVPGQTLWKMAEALAGRPVLWRDSQLDGKVGERLTLRRELDLQAAAAIDTRDRVVSSVRESRRVLVAGHDLKFAGGIMSWLRAQGHEVLTDLWTDHSKHDSERSAQLLDQADNVFCEWSLGNVEWYAAHRTHQRLTSRFHSQELFTPHLKRLNVNLVDRTVFVGDYVRQAAIRRFGYEESRTIVVPNAMGVGAGLESTVQDEQRRHVLGLVGMVPRQKHLDRALDVLSALRKSDRRFELRVKGRRPEEYPWMLKREHEIGFYRDLFKRISEDVHLRGAVHFDAHGNDMEDWYAKVGVVLSVSDFESFHMTLVDGAASGALPVSLDWPGANLIYPANWLFPTVKTLSEHIAHTVGNDECFQSETDRARQFAVTNFDPNAVYARLGAVILGDER